METTEEVVFNMCIRDALIHNTQPFVVKNGESQRKDPIAITSKEPDYEQLYTRFCWLSSDIVKRTFAKTTQYARMPQGAVIQKRYKSSFPIINIFLRNKHVTPDTIFFDTSAIDSGATCAQIFVGCTSLLTNVYGIK